MSWSWPVFAYFTTMALIAGLGSLYIWRTLKREWEETGRHARRPWLSVRVEDAWVDLLLAWRWLSRRVAVIVPGPSVSETRCLEAVQAAGPGTPTPTEAELDDAWADRLHEIARENDAWLDQAAGGFDPYPAPSWVDELVRKALDGCSTWDEYLRMRGLAAVSHA